MPLGYAGSPGIRQSGRSASCLWHTLSGEGTYKLSVGGRGIGRSRAHLLVWYNCTSVYTRTNMPTEIHYNLLYNLGLHSLVM